MLDSQNGMTCDGCGQELPLRSPRKAEAAATWQCAKCGLKYRAVFNLNTDDEIHGNVRPGSVESY